MEKKIDFNDYEWHDAVLKDLHIDRSNPGHNDTISMDIVWPDKTKSIIIFEDVYKAIMELNFGAIGTDCILEADIAPGNDKDLVALKDEWKDANIGEVHCYVFQTTTAGSKIKIIAKNFTVQ